MKARKVITTLLMAVALAGIAMAVGCKKQASTQSSGQSVKYTCSMHPEVVQDKPGNCPKCGMALVEKR